MTTRRRIHHIVKTLGTEQQAARETQGSGSKFREPEDALALLLFSAIEPVYFILTYA